MIEAKGWNTARTLGLAALGTAVLWTAARRRRRIELRGAVAIVTGGGRGLGFAIAEELAREGCRLAICGRNREVLATAVASLRARGAEVIASACDASNEQDMALFVDRVLAHYGRIDVLVNNAGQCFVGPAADLQGADVAEAIQNIFWVQYRPTMAVLPHMRQRGAGRIVNVTSMGGKLPLPHQAAYVAGKFAATGWSETLAVELRKDGIEVSTVTPPPLQNGAPLHAHFNGHAEDEFRWFARSLTSPLSASSAVRAARAVVSAARYGDAERAVSFSSWLGARAYGLAPNVMSRLFSFVDRGLPPPSLPGESTRMQQGTRVVAGSRHPDVHRLAGKALRNERKYQPRSRLAAQLSE